MHLRQVDAAQRIDEAHGIGGGIIGANRSRNRIERGNDAECIRIEQLARKRKNDLLLVLRTRLVTFREVERAAQREHGIAVERLLAGGDVEVARVRVVDLLAHVDRQTAEGIDQIPEPIGIGFDEMGNAHARIGGNG